MGGWTEGGWITCGRDGGDIRGGGGGQGESILYIVGG